MTNKTVLLELLNLNQLVDERVIEALRRLDQIDDLALWYEGFNPIPLLQGLASHQLKQALEASALCHYNDHEYVAFMRLWQDVNAEAQRQLLCDIAGLAAPSLINAM
mgnify:FL=1|jgi:hypothetical protein|tara:strand:- start:89 stop:409 length:321 start_codon:yes stop_codon:yes gene_type:complete